MRADALMSNFELTSIIGIAAVGLALPIITEVALRPLFDSQWYKERVGDSPKQQFFISAGIAFFVLDSYGLDLFAMLSTAIGHPVAAGTIGTTVSALFLAGGRGAVDTLLSKTGVKSLLSSKKSNQKVIEVIDNEAE